MSDQARRKRWVARGVVSLLLLGGCLTGSQDGAPMRLREEQLIVALDLVDPGLREASARRLEQQYPVALVAGFPLVSIDVYCAVFSIDRGVDPGSVLAQLADQPGVLLVQRNRLFQTVVSGEADPYASLQHGAIAIRARDAHRYATGKGVRIAVVDSGIDRLHPDLSGRMPESLDFVRGRNRRPVAEAHGTAVAGVIAAVEDNGAGIYGVAPDAEIMGLRACRQREAGVARADCSSWTLALGIDAAIEAGVSILNLSLAGRPDPLVEALLRRARSRGVIIVAAAGSTHGDAGAFPASLEGVIAVVQSDEEPPAEERDWHREDAVVAAPGLEILTTAPGDRYDMLSGSSLAAAHVSGVVALLLEHRPELTPEGVSQALRSVQRGGGVPRVDACAALLAVQAIAACP